jgi:uncharacterized protein (DUF2235 family)
MALYAFDGTWNREHDQAHYSENSNVVKFAKAYTGRKSVFQKNGDAEHIVDDDDKAYFTGPGTRHGFVGKALGGLMGLGGRTRVAEAIKRVERKFSEGDYIIDVIGFSRGSAIALHFVNELAEIGFLPGQHNEAVQPRVRFLGLWDVVAAFGIPRDVGFLKFQKINLFWHLTLPAIVDHCFHALALDERRAAFQPTRVAGSYEVWFRGVHSDIGGGNENELRNNIALRWMLRKAASVRVPVDTALAEALKIDEDAPIGVNLDPIADPFRIVIAGDHGHYTVKAATSDHAQNLPATCMVESVTFETTRISLHA